MKGFGAVISLTLILAFATIAYASHSWNGYHWARTANPFTLKVGDNVSTAWDAYLDEAVSDWSVSAVLDLQKVAGGTNPKNCKAVGGRIEACSSKYGYNGWLGLAQIWVSGSHITKAVTKVNDSYFNLPTYNTPGWRRMVMCQEIAHDFGLDHQDEIFNNLNLGSCMDYTNDPDGTLADPDQLSNEHPNLHDYDQLALIYEHLDSATAGRPNPKDRPANVDLENPSQWGKEVRQSPNGRNSLFERDLGNGEKVFTFIIWAD